MKNPVVDLFTEMSDEELTQGIKEMQEDEKEGIIRMDGVVRKYANEVRRITECIIPTALFLTQTSLYREAAYRWVKVEPVTMPI
jgi:hypothetical protein